MLQTPADLVEQVGRALAEDVGRGDLTAALVPEGRSGRARVITREAAVLCGRPWFDEVFRQIDPSVRVEWEAAEGAAVEPGQLLCRIDGAALRYVDLRRANLKGGRSQPAGGAVLFYGCLCPAARA